MEVRLSRSILKNAIIFAVTMDMFRIYVLFEEKSPKHWIDRLWVPDHICIIRVHGCFSKNFTFVNFATIYKLGYMILVL